MARPTNIHDVFDAGAAGTTVLSFLGPRELSFLGAADRRVRREVRDDVARSCGNRLASLRCRCGGDESWTLALSVVSSHPSASDVLDSLFERMERWNHSVPPDARSSAERGALAVWCVGPHGREFVSYHYRAEVKDRRAAIGLLFDPNKMGGGHTRRFRDAEERERRTLKSIEDWVRFLVFRADTVAGTWMRQCTHRDPPPGDDTKTVVVMITLPGPGLHVEAKFVDYAPYNCL